MAENNFLFAPDQQEQLNQGYMVQPGLPVNSVIQGGVIQQNPQNQFNGVVLNQVTLICNINKGILSLDIRFPLVAICTNLTLFFSPPTTSFKI